MTTEKLSMTPSMLSMTPKMPPLTAPNKKGAAAKQPLHSYSAGTGSTQEMLVL